MSADPAALRSLMQAIAEGDDARAQSLLAAEPGLALARLEGGATRAEAKAWYLREIEHYLYKGDTALHVAAAGYRIEITRRVIELGAELGARNRRGATPLHYSADGIPGSAAWDPAAQAATISALIAAGADPNARDAAGVTPLHRAVRTRCAAAVSALLEGGADPQLANARGSTPLALASAATGRGGAGSPEAKAEQAVIIRRLAP